MRKSKLLVFIWWKVLELQSNVNWKLNVCFNFGFGLCHAWIACTNVSMTIGKNVCLNVCTYVGGYVRIFNIWKYDCYPKLWIFFFFWLYVLKSSSISAATGLFRSFQFSFYSLLLPSLSLFLLPTGKGCCFHLFPKALITILYLLFTKWPTGRVSN